TFRVTDACGSIDQLTYDFIVKNCKGPIAKCVNLVTVPMGGPTGMVEVCAKDFNARSEDICSDTSTLLFTFIGAYPVIDSINVVHFFKGNGELATLAEYNAGLAQRWDPSSKTSCRIVTCATPRTFFMTVWDEDRNASNCQVTLTLDGCCVDNTPPIITNRDTTFRFINTSTNCTGPVLVNLSASATDNETSTPNLKWIFELDRGNNGSIDSTGLSRTISVNLPVGTHRVKFIAEDSCFNMAMVTYLIDIYNDKGPSAICRDTLRISLGSGSNMAGMYILSAKDLDNLTTPSFDSCSTDTILYTFGGTYPVQDSIDRIHYFTGNGVLSTEAIFLAGNAFRWNPTTKSSETKLGCGQVGTFTRTLTVWDRDERSSSCTTTILLTGECPASLGDFVWEDLNGNGRQDAGEPGIPNVRVRLLNANNNMVIDSQLTNAQGIYCFDSLAAGTYRVQFVTPLGFIPTTRNAVDAVSGNNSDPFVNTGITDVVTIVVNQTNKDIDAGYFKLGAIGDFVWRDNNANGRQDAGEAGIPNVRVILQNNAGAAIDSLLTDNQGIYCFDSLVPGTYRVFFRTPSGFSLSPSNEVSVNDSLDSDPINGLVSGIVIASGQSNKTIDAGFVPPSNLCEDHPYTGFAIGTCTTYTGTNLPVAVIYDVRPNATIARDKNWAPNQIMGSNWTIDSIGQVFGIATDDSANVYLAHTDVYLIQNNQPDDIPPGRIYKARPPLFRAEVFVTLPNSGGPFNGIG
ncbi:MAG TPA: SdrD B-like domain-containing protein, partial [Saprospiraceae bacterium]|nr:SdrD B-like domain-containing protein [Saprospiraceae bacterium]